MKCSFIVSAFDRPDHLACLLYALKAQTEADFEVIVTDNSEGKMLPVVSALQDERFLYLAAAKPDCYASANVGAAMARGEYLCFPSDDGYYAPRFLALMLAGGEGADLIYSDCVYDGHGCTYSVMAVSPRLGEIDKGGFLVRRGLFPGFDDSVTGDRAADGQLIEKLISASVRHAKVPGYLWVHN